GDKGAQPAKVQKLLCDADVWMEEAKREALRLIATKRIECAELAVDNEYGGDDREGAAVAPRGQPGLGGIWQRGTKDESCPVPGKPSGTAPGKERAGTGPPGTPQEEEFKLTYISYMGKMVAHSKHGMATFFDRVVVIQVPTDDPDLKIEENNPPKGSMYMSCEKLEVFNHKSPDGKTATQEMRAYRKVHVEGQGYSGQAELVTYDEAKGQLIFEGDDGNPAILRQEKPGQEGKSIRGKKIFYYPRTGDFHGEGIKDIIGDR